MMHPHALMVTLFAALVVASTFGLASASVPGGFSEAGVKSLKVRFAAREALTRLNEDAQRAAAHNLTVPVTLVDIKHADVQIVAGNERRPGFRLPGSTTWGPAAGSNRHEGRGLN